jgi:hypothetical protein
MDDSDRPRFARALLVLATAFDVDMGEPRMAGYWLGLSDLTIEQVEQACAMALKGAKFFPRPVELREFICGNVADAATRAWLAWRLAAHRLGGGASVIVKDAVLADTLVAVFGGWPEACALELSREMWASKQKEFDRVFAVMAQRGVVGVRYLVGYHEQNNQERVDEWRKFTPVGVIDGDQVTQISGEEARAFQRPAEPRLLESEARHE